MAERIANVTLLELPGADAVPYVGDTTEMIGAIEEFLTGARRSSVERVITTLLFTDIVGSTELATRHGNAHWRDLLERHDQVVRSVLTRFVGREINTAGDGFLASFDSPRLAIDCAVAIHRALEHSGTPVRIGIHTGEVEVRGRDVAGLTVHIASRVAAHAGPHDVVVSPVVPQMLVGSEYGFDELGEHELKGLNEPWRLYRVRT